MCLGLFKRKKKIRKVNKVIHQNVSNTSYWGTAIQLRLLCALPVHLNEATRLEDLQLECTAQRREAGQT